MSSHNTSPRRTNVHLVPEDNPNFPILLSSWVLYHHFHHSLWSSYSVCGILLSTVWGNWVTYQTATESASLGSTVLPRILCMGCLTHFQRLPIPFAWSGHSLGRFILLGGSCAQKERFWLWSQSYSILNSVYPKLVGYHWEIRLHAPQFLLLSKQSTPLIAIVRSYCVPHPTLIVLELICMVSVPSLALSFTRQRIWVILLNL